MKYRIVFSILCILLLQGIYAQTKKHPKQTFYNESYRKAKVRKVEMPTIYETYTYENGFLTEILNTRGENRRKSRVFSYDFENGTFSEQVNVFKEDSLSQSYSKLCECPVLENILESTKIDFIDDTRLNLVNLIGDTIFIYVVKRIDDPQKGSGFYFFDTVRREDQLLSMLLVITKDAIGHISVESIIAGTDKTVRIRFFNFDSRLRPTSRVDHMATIKTAHTYKVNRKRIKRETVDLTRSKETYVYSTKINKYKYNCKGLLTKQESTNQYHVQGHMTSSVTKYKYSYN